MNQPNQKPPFSIPRIYDAGGDITKTWRVEYFYTHPITLERKRIIAPKENANKIKDPKKRYDYLENIRQKVYSQLQNGYCPFGDVVKNNPRTAKYTTIIDALNAVLDYKKLL